LGYSQVQEAQQLERYDPEIYQSSIEYLQQGLKLAESLQDWQSKSLCCSSLGLAYLVLERTQEAINILLQGLESAKYYGDVYLQGLLLTCSKLLVNSDQIKAKVRKVEMDNLAPNFSLYMR